MNGKNDGISENEEMLELIEELRNIISSHKGPFYFFDLHSTSSDTSPFITINDMLVNRELSSNYPIPVILGLEEFLEGPFLSFMNEVGYPCLGFEAGQHDSIHSIEHQKEFIYLSLFYTGFIDQSEFPKFNQYYSALAQTSARTQKFFEIEKIHKVKEGDKFKMEPGFVNFQKVSKGETVAKDKSGEIKISKDSRILMPLYQNQGEDGFFLIKSTPKFWLDLSKKMRNLKLDFLLTFLPGVNFSADKRTLIVNKNIAIFFAKKFMHLLGYRVRNESENKILFTKRDHGLNLEILNL